MRGLRLYVGAIQVLHIGLVENCGHGLQTLKKGLDRDEMFPAENPGLKGCLVAIIREDIPSTENQVVQEGQRHKILNKRNAILKAFAQADGSHLGQGTYGKG